MNCPKCGFESHMGMRFCGRCGTSLAITCPSCGFANPQDYLFCGNCGNPLTGEVPTLPGVEPGVFSVPGLLLKEKGSGELPSGVMDGERRIVTVILADVRRSTDLLEKIGTEAWVGIMNQVFQLLNAEIYRFGGEVDQFRGDGLVAFFGTNIAHEDDPERGVLAALAMQQTIKSFAARLEEQKKIEIQLRVGVNTGEVIVASVGSSDQHQEDTAMGEAVTLAARMEAAAEPGTVLVSENTYRIVENRFHWQKLGDMNFKGMSKPVAVYRPISPRFDFETAPDLQAYGIPVAMTGREDEFIQLKDVIAGLYRGRGGIVLVSGEKGIGKSLLVTQVRQYFSREEVMLGELRGEDPPAVSNSSGRLPITWLRGTCRSYDQSWPFAMWVDVLYQWLGLRPDEAPEQKSSILYQKSLNVWGDLANRYYPYLAKFLSIPVDEEHEERVRYLDAEGLRKQFYVTIRQWLEALAKANPVVISFVDLHWADNASLELLKYCLSVCEQQPLVLLVVFRLERTSPAWGFRYYVETEYPHRLTIMDLKPLSDEESKELIHQMLGLQVLSDRTESLLVSKAEGNPYFIREMISSLIAQEVLIQEPDSCEWRETRAVTTLDLPESLQGLILERLDRLSAEERRTLQAASIMGMSFWRNVLESLMNGTGQVGETLTSLQRKGIIQEINLLPGLGMEYQFVSSLVRDAVYESMLAHQQKAHHQKVASYLEECGCLENWLQHSSLIAFHYRRAESKRQELFYTMKAAEQARSIYAMNEAAEHLTRAFELLEEMEAAASSEMQLDVIRTNKFDVLNDRSAVYFQLGLYAQSEADAKSLLALSELLADDPYWRVDALLRQPEVHNPEGYEELNTGLTMIQEALELSRKLGDKIRELHSLGQLIHLQFLVHDYAWKINAETAIALAQELGDKRAQVNLLLEIGSSYGVDELDKSLKYLEMAIPLTQELDDKGTEMKLLRAFAEQYERSGDYYRQLTEFEQRRLEISREIGNRLAEGDAIMYCGQVQGIYLGDYENGLHQLRESLRLWEGTSGSLFPLLRIAQLQTALGKYREAQETLEIAQPIVEGNIWDLGRAGFAMVSAILNNNLVDEQHVREVITLGERINCLVAEKLVSRQYEMAAACEVSAAYLRLGVFVKDDAERQTCKQQALDASSHSLQIYQQFGFAQIVECFSETILYRHSQALKANGLLDDSRLYAQKAYIEMMRKHDLIPPKSPFRKTYLNQIKIHQQIREEYYMNAADELTEANEIGK